MKELRILLWTCSILCLLGFLIALFPWPMITAIPNWTGTQPPAINAITVFMFRLCLVLFGVIGIFFAILALNPLKYGAMLTLAAYGLVGYGIFSLIGGIRYGLSGLVYYGDVIFGIVAGLLLLSLRKKAMQNYGA